MRLSELKELRPDVWEILKNECVRLYGHKDWNKCVLNDDKISNTIIYADSEQGYEAWRDIVRHRIFFLMDKWIAENEPT